MEETLRVLPDVKNRLLQFYEKLDSDRRDFRPETEEEKTFFEKANRLIELVEVELKIEVEEKVVDNEIY